MKVAMGVVGESKQKCKSKFLTKIFFAAVILCNVHCLDCHCQRENSSTDKNQESKKFLHENSPGDKAQYIKTIPRLSDTSGTASKYYEQKEIMNRNPVFFLIGKLNRGKSSKHQFREDKLESSIKRIRESFQSAHKPVLRGSQFYFLTSNKSDKARGSTNFTTTEAKLTSNLSTGKIAKMPIFARSNRNSLVKHDQISYQRHVANNSINLGMSKENKWTITAPEIDGKAITTYPQFSKTGQLQIIPDQDGWMQVTGEKSILFNRLVKELKEDENEMLPIQESNTIIRTTRDLSIENTMKNKNASSADPIKDFLPVQERLHNFREDNQDQKHFSYYIFSNTNDTETNDTSTNGSTFADSENLPPEGNKDDEPLTVIEVLYDKFPVQVWKSVGLFEDSYIENGIDPHWMSFEPPNPIVHDILAVLYSIIMSVGCSGNFLVLYMFVRCRSLRIPANYLVANLAISDFFMLAKMPIFIFNSIYRGPALGAIGCKIYGFVGGLTGTASIMTLTAISIERYYAICHPLNPFKRTSTRTLLMITSIWIYSLVFSMIPLLGLNGYVSEGYLTSCSFDYLSKESGSRIFVFVFFVAAWLFPLSVIVFSYVEIFKMVQEAEKMSFSVDKDGSCKERVKYKRNQTKIRTEIKIAIISAGVIALWILSWSPYAIVALLGIFGKKKYITPFVSAVPALFCKTASCVDPFVYAISHPRFQRELKAKLSICFPSGRNFLTRSIRDNSFASVSGRVSASPQLSFSDHVCSSTVKCRPGSFNPNCPCKERNRQSHKRKIPSQLKAMKINSEHVAVDEIEMRQVRLERFSKNTKTKAISLEFPEEDYNKPGLEEQDKMQDSHIQGSTESCYCHTEQQEILLHVSTTHLADLTSCETENEKPDLMSIHNKTKENYVTTDSEDNI